MKNCNVERVMYEHYEWIFTGKFRNLEMFSQLNMR